MKTLHAVPEGICRTCFNVRRATKPMPDICWCHHSRTAARQTAGGQWRVLTAVSDEELAQLRSGVIEPHHDGDASDADQTATAPEQASSCEAPRA